MSKKTPRVAPPHGSNATYPRFVRFQADLALLCRKHRVDLVTDLDEPADLYVVEAGVYPGDVSGSLANHLSEG